MLLVTVLYLTVFLSLLLVMIFASLFLRDRRNSARSSAERSALMPLAEDGPARPAGKHGEKEAAGKGRR